MILPDIALEPASLSPIALFLQADIVVKVVMAGLLIASILLWVVIVQGGLRLRRAQREAEQFEREFWRAANVEEVSANPRHADSPSGRILSAGLNEWKRSTSRAVVDRAGVRERLGAVLDGAISMEVERLAGGFNLLATIAASAPFIGLFGTVWGIMRSFSGIASAGNSSLAVVAPGIAEALFATAIGLFAAIPALIAYNRFIHLLAQVEGRYWRFADGFHAMLSRELERG